MGWALSTGAHNVEKVASQGLTEEFQRQKTALRPPILMNYFRGALARAKLRRGAIFFSEFCRENRSFFSSLTFNFPSGSSL